MIKAALTPANEVVISDSISYNFPRLALIAILNLRLILELNFVKHFGWHNSYVMELRTLYSTSERPCLALLLIKIK